MRTLSLVLCILLVFVLLPGSLPAQKRANNVDIETIVATANQYQEDTIPLYHNILKCIGDISDLKKQRNLSDTDIEAGNITTARGFAALCHIHAILSCNSLFMAKIMAMTNGSPLHSYDEGLQEEVYQSITRDLEIVKMYSNVIADPDMKTYVDAIASNIEMAMKNTASLFGVFMNIKGTKMDLRKLPFYAKADVVVQGFQHEADSLRKSIAEKIDKLGHGAGRSVADSREFTTCSEIGTLVSCYAITLKSSKALYGSYDFSQSSKDVLMDNLRGPVVAGYIDRLSSRLDFIHGQLKNYCADGLGCSLGDECRKLLQACDKAEARLATLSREMVREQRP